MGGWILLTGASSGIGRNTAKYLDTCGYKLVLVARNGERLEALKKELNNSNFIYEFDLCNLSDIGKIFEKCAEEDLKLDGMVHCAGTGVVNSVRTNSIDDMQRIMTTNYFSFVELVKYFGARKYSNDGASIVAISSISSLTCYTGSCNYSASKSAIDAAVKVMSKEYLKRKIRVNAILPGYVDTPFGPPKDDPDYIAQQPLGIIETPYVSYLIEYLLSEKSKYMTGSLIPMSGGMIF